MRDPLHTFRESDDDLSDVVKTARRKQFFSWFIPLFCIAVAAGFVASVIKYGSSAPVNLASAGAVPPAGKEKAVDSAEAERAAMAHMSAMAGNESQNPSSAYDIGDEVEMAGGAFGFGFAEETDLNTFRMMLRSKDSSKARRYFEQLKINNKSATLPVHVAMEVVSVAWNGTLCLHLEGRKWWVAQEWVCSATEESKTAAAETEAAPPRPATVAEPAPAEAKPSLAPPPAARKSYLDSLPSASTLGAGSGAETPNEDSSLPVEFK